MLLLAIDSSGLTASAALVTETAVLAEYNTNYKKTHSQTLLPMIDEILRMTQTAPEDLDGIAVAKGPGSFTGLRIGSATAKGIALSAGIPIVEVSTLEAMAYQLYGTKDLICPMMDARRQQVYTGIYRFDGETLLCESPDEAVPAAEMAAKLNGAGRPVVLLGDGVPVNRETIENSLTVPYTFALAFQDRQRAAALGTLALAYAAQGRWTDPADHAPVYLRVSQAERERAERRRKEGQL